MSTPPPENQASESLTPKEANAQAKAAKAQAKAMRPWYKKPLPLIGVAILAVIAIQVAGGGSDSNTDTAADPGTSETAATDSGPKIGSPARDGKFEFIVNSIDCGIASVGQDFLEVKAQGEFCKVSLSVENVGDEAQMMFDSNQYLYDDQDRKFSASSETLLADESNSEFFLKDINPGISVTGVIYFDVPAGTAPTEIELHDSLLSGGVKVSLK